MKATTKTVQVSPLLGMERAFFEECKKSLGADYASRVQGLVDEWEATSEAVGMLRRKRFLEVRIVTFFGSIAVRVHQGINPKDRWVSPALAFLGIKPYQRYSPDIEKRMAMLAVETGSYEKAATLADAMWFTLSDDTARALLLRLEALRLAGRQRKAQGHHGQAGRGRSGGNCAVRLRRPPAAGNGANGIPAGASRILRHGRRRVAVEPLRGSVRTLLEGDARLLPPQPAPPCLGRRTPRPGHREGRDVVR